MGFGNTLAGIGAGVAGGFGAINKLLAGNHPYPMTGIGLNFNARLVTNIPPFNDGAWKSSGGYSFKVVRVLKPLKGLPGAAQGIAQLAATIIGVSGEVTIPAEGWSEFVLQINPQELTQDEIFAIEVTPTFRGVMVEHQGITLKDISISGTTGQSPGRREAGADAATGRPILSAGRSGYEEFHELRSFFRVYVEQKRVDPVQGQGELRMIFTNYKDQEALYVEPQKFIMKRNAAKPFMYDYTIQLKAIGVASFKPALQDIFGSTTDAITRVRSGLSAALTTLRNSRALIERSEKSFNADVIVPVAELLNFMSTSTASGDSFSTAGYTRTNIENLKSTITDSEVNLNEALGRDTSDYNSAAGRTATLMGNPNRQTTYDELKALNALGQIKRSLSQLLSQESIFSSDANDERARVEDIYGGKLRIPAVNSTKVSRVVGGDTIQTLAARELGDPDRFKDIAMVNNLKPPYITAAGGNGTLKPGDKLLIPQSTSSATSALRKLKVFEINKFLSEAEKNLGIDIRLTEDGDLAMNNTSDLDLIAGMDNMIQVLALRTELERGSLKRHPEIGTSLSLGEKATTRTLVDLRNDLVTSIASDPRVQAIPSIQLNQEGGEIRSDIVVILKNLDQPIPIPLKLQTA